tara:strand:+ start:217 stop:351 length:135 start_codon:yes stop_codon:yes gene_type:complete
MSNYGKSQHPEKIVRPQEDSQDVLENTKILKRPKNNYDPFLKRN